MSNLYSHREAQNGERFDQLANTLNQFRNTVENDIHAGIQNEQLTLDLLNDNFGQLWSKLKRSSGDLRTVMNRNASLAKLVGLFLLMAFILWTLNKLR